MSQRIPRKRGRPAQNVLSTELIVSAARELLRTVGESFTMSMLARQLGVAPSSLYNHVQSKGEVLAKISDDVVTSIDVTALRNLPAVEEVPGDGPAVHAARWREAAEAWAHSYFRAFAHEPTVVATLAVTPVAQAPQTLAMYEEVTAAFMRAGWPEEHTLSLIETIEAFLLGSALDAAAPDDIFDPSRDAERFPHMSRVYRFHRDTTGPEAAQRAFELGVGAFFTGLEHTLRGHLERRRTSDGGTGRTDDAAAD